MSEAGRGKRRKYDDIVQPVSEFSQVTQSKPSEGILSRKGLNHLLSRLKQSEGPDEAIQSSSVKEGEKVMRRELGAGPKGGGSGRPNNDRLAPK